MNRSRIRQLIAPPQLGTQEENRVARTLHAILLIPLMASPLFVILAWFHRDWGTLGALLVAQLPLWGAVWLLRRWRLQAAGLTFCLTTLAVVTAICTTGQGIHDVTIVVYPGILIAASLVLDRRAFALTALLTLLSVTWVALGAPLGWYHPQPYSTEGWQDWINVGRILALIALLIYAMADSLQRSLSQTQREIAERKQAEAARQASEQRYCDFVEQSTDGIWLLGLDRPVSLDQPPEEQVRQVRARGYVAECNDALARMYGYEAREDMIGKRFPDLYGDTPSEGNFQSSRQLVREGYRSFDRLTEEVNSQGERVYSLNSAIGVIQDGYLVGLWGTQRDITELRRAEQALQANERRYRALFERTNDAVFILSLDGIYLAANGRAGDMLGYSPEELVGKPSHIVVAPSDLDDSQNRLEMLLAGQELPVYERTFQHRDGTEVLVEIDAALVYDDEGRPLHIQSIVRDITERKRAEQALQASNEKIRGMFESSTDSITFTDLQGNIVEVNEAAVRLHGYEDRSEMIGLSAFALIAEQDRAFAAENLQETATTGHSGILEYRFVTRDGIEFDAELSATLLHDERGEPAGFVALTRDISQRKRAERLLQTLNELALSLEQALMPQDVFCAVGEAFQKLGLYCGVMTVDESRENVSVAYVPYPTRAVNAALTQNASQDDPLCWPIESFKSIREALVAKRTVFIPDIREVIPQVTPGSTIRTILENMGTFNVILAPLVVQEHAEGLLWVQTRRSTGEDVPIVTAFANQVAAAWHKARLFQQAQQEVIERRRAEQEVHLLNEALEQRVTERTAELATSNRELEAFAYTVSHDLRAPLRAIDGFSRIVANEYVTEIDDKGQRYLGLVSENVGRMSQLIDDLLAFSRLSRQSLQIQDVDVTALVESVIEDLAPERQSRQIEITHDDLPPCQADPGLLRQVLANLLSNAQKYTRARETAHIHVGCQQQGRQIVYYVRDNGVGFDMRYANKLFGVFERLHHNSAYEGTGVGLAIAQRIIQRHGGQIWAESAPDQGATFFFVLKGSSRG